MKRFLLGCSFLLLIGSDGRSGEPAAGFVDGHLRILASKEVQMAEETPGKVFSEAYAEFPLVVLDKAGSKQVTRFTADEKGNYHVALPPGDYILDLEGRGPGRGGPRAKPQPFTIVSNQTAHVDMTIDTHVR